MGSKGKNVNFVNIIVLVIFFCPIILVLWQYIYSINHSPLQAYDAQDILYEIPYIHLSVNSYRILNEEITIFPLIIIFTIFLIIVAVLLGIVNYAPEEDIKNKKEKSNILKIYFLSLFISLSIICINHYYIYYSNYNCSKAYYDFMKYSSELGTNYKDIVTTIIKIDEYIQKHPDTTTEEARKIATSYVGKKVAEKFNITDKNEVLFESDGTFIGIENLKKFQSNVNKYWIRRFNKTYYFHEYL